MNNSHHNKSKCRFENYFISILYYFINIRVTRKFVTKKWKKIIRIIYYFYMIYTFAIKNRKFEYNFKSCFLLKNKFINLENTREDLIREKNYCLSIFGKEKEITNFMKFNLTPRHYFFIYLTLNLSGML